MAGPQSRLSSLLPAHQGCLLQRSTQTAAFQEVPRWAPDSPLARGQSKQCQTCSEPYSRGCQCLLSIPLVRFSLRVHCVSAGASLCQPAREAHYPSAATLTVSNSPAHASQAGQGQSPHGPGPGKHPRRGQHHPQHMGHRLLRSGQERPETTASGILTQAYGALSYKVKDSVGLQDESDTCSQLCANVRELMATV